MFKIVLSNQTLLQLAFSNRIGRALVRGNLLKLSSYSDRSVADHIYTSIKLNNRTSKESRANRFQDIDQHTVDLLKEFDKPVFHDVGVSSGITSFELYSLLQEQGVSCSFNISDKFAKFYYEKTPLYTKIYDSEKKFLNGYVGPIFADQESSGKFFITRWVFQLLNKRPVSKELGAILLYDPKVLSCIANKEIFHQNYDIFAAPMDEKCSYLRCMNLLNKGYFPDELIIKGVTNLFHSITEGGVLQIGRTVDGVNYVSFFRKNDQQLDVIKHLNEGTEILGLIDSIDFKTH